MGWQCLVHKGVQEHPYLQMGKPGHRAPKGSARCSQQTRPPGEGAHSSQQCSPMHKPGLRALPTTIKQVAGTSVLSSTQTRSCVLGASLAPGTDLYGTHLHIFSIAL
mgnify:FL=1